MHLGVGYHLACVIYGAIDKHVPRGDVFEWGTAVEIRHCHARGGMARKDSTQRHQIGAAGQQMRPACRIGDHVAHVLLHVARQPVNFCGQICGY